MYKFSEKMFHTYANHFWIFFHILHNRAFYISDIFTDYFTFPPGTLQGQNNYTQLDHSLPSLKLKVTWIPWHFTVQHCWTCHRRNALHYCTIKIRNTWFLQVLTMILFIILPCCLQLMKVMTLGIQWQGEVPNYQFSDQGTITWPITSLP